METHDAPNNAAHHVRRKPILRARRIIAAPLLNLDIGKRSDVLPHLSEPVVANLERPERAAHKLGQIDDTDPVDARIAHSIEDKLFGVCPCIFSDR